jgi:ubiquinone/menaquinone biosynthesis C-methylase UbiE
MSDHKPYDTNPFYDAVADHYHLFYRNWESAVDREGAMLRRLLTAHHVQTVLDASCGPGTQALPLAKHGFRVTAADLNATMIEKARENAINYGVADQITFLHAGFLELTDKLTSGSFDALITKGNALPHLLTDQDLSAALRNFHRLLKPGGVLVIGMRNYDLLLEDRPRFIPGQFHDDPYEQHILFDIWDWEDGPPVIITFNKFRVSGQGETYQVAKHTVRYRALTRDELEDMLTQAGFDAIKVEQQQWENVYTALSR